MKTTVLKFGLYGMILSIILFGAALVFASNLDYGLQEVIGYASMIISLSVVFFGIKHFRDIHNNGKVSFGKALLIGVLISVATAAGVAIMDWIYTSYINPDFSQEYLEKTLETMQESLSPKEFQAQKETLVQQMEAYGSPGFMALLMFITVVVLGFVISLISALVLQRK